MKLINSKLLENFDSFIGNISASDRIAIYHDSDPDGTCSAVIVAKAIERRIGKRIDAHIGRIKGEHYVSVELAEKLRSMNINKLITLDISADEKPEGISVVKEFARVLVIDHHKMYNDLNAPEWQNCILVKPQLLYTDVDPQTYCTSKFVFDLMGRHAKIDDLDWLASVGTIADVASKAWVQFLKQVFEKYRIPLKKDFFRSMLGKIAHIISSAEVYDEKNTALCFDVLYDARHPDDVLKSALSKFEKVISKEINHFTKNAKNLAEFYDDINLVFYFFEPKHAITSPLSTILGFKYPEKTVIVASAGDGQIHVSIRRQDKKLAVNNLVEVACNDFENSNAGGHAAAAGATFPARYLSLFKKRIIEQLEHLSTRE